MTADLEIFDLNDICFHSLVMISQDPGVVVILNLDCMIFPEQHIAFITYQTRLLASSLTARASLPLMRRISAGVAPPG